MHNYTDVSIDSKAVHLKISLHPDNYKMSSSFVNKKYVRDFRKRIDPFIDMLSKQIIPLVIESHTQEDKNAKVFPVGINKFFVNNISNSRYNLPNESSSFFGRQNTLKEINKKLKDSKNASPLLIFGDRKAGKTEIVIKYAYEHSSEYDWIFWMNSTSKDSLYSDFIEISKFLGLGEFCNGQEAEAREKVQNWLGEHNNWLLVYDNVNDLDLLSMVKNTIVYGYEGHIVIISSLNNTEVFNKFETIKIDNYDPKGHYSSKMDEIEALYTNSIYGARIDHFRHEKEILAYEVVDWIYDKYLLKNKSKICLLIDSGTTTYHVFREISKMINKYDEKKKRWKENVCIVTNNLPGSQYFMLNCRKSDDERSGTVLPCILLPGKTLSIYAAIASEETTAWISGKKKGRDTKSEMRKSLENEWKCGSHDYKIISIVSTNYVVCHKENGLERFLPVARGKEHFNVKREVIKAGDEVIIISPLMKFSFASVNLLNAVNKFTIPQVSDEADDNPSQVEYKEIFTEDKKVTWFITTRKKYEEGRKRIFGEFSEKLVNKLKEAYDNVQHFEFELEKDNYHKTLDFDRELELEIPHFALRNNYRGQNIWNEELIDAIEEMYFGKPEKQ